jgi:hypothetical protein
MGAIDAALIHPVRIAVLGTATARANRVKLQASSPTNSACIGSIR